MSTVESAAAAANIESAAEANVEPAATNTIILKSSDGELFNVEESVAIQCETIKHMIEDDCADSAIPLPNVSSKILAKVIAYCKRHAQDASAAASTSTSEEEELKNFDTELVNIDHVTLIDLILAANYLNVKKLLNLACQTVTDMIKEKTPEEVREIFNIKNDFTPEEEEEVRREYEWAHKKPNQNWGN